MLCQPPGAQTTLARTVTQGFRTAGKEFREILLAGQCLHLGHAPEWFISKKKQRAAAQRMALPVEPVLHHIRAVQGSAVHHGCTARKLPSLFRLCCRRRRSSYRGVFRYTKSWMKKSHETL
jgi:hypothetical protein